MTVLRKIKDKIKKVIEKKKKIKAVKASSVKTKKKGILRKIIKKEPLKKEKEILGLEEVAVEKTKFSHPEAPKPPMRVMPQDLPWGYGRDKIVLQVRDPRWLHTYWEVINDTWNRLKAQLQDKFNGAKMILRVYDVTNINFDGTNAHSSFDIELSYGATNWYIDTNGPGRSWCVDLGLKLSNGEFITIVRSNTVCTPLEGPSWITDEEWMIPEDMFGRLYGLGFGLGQSSPVGKAWQERVKKVLFSGAMASPGMASMASPVKKVPKERNFWLVVDCELIVYGATEPDAKVTVQDKEIKLRPDGSFTLRFALPDGEQVIPVKAVSSDELEERTITPIVTRETKTARLLKESAHKSE
jgi:hypothetical protein